MRMRSTYLALFGHANSKQQQQQLQLFERLRTYICDETGTDTCVKDVEFGRIWIPPFFPFKEGSLKMWVEK